MVEFKKSMSQKLRMDGRDYSRTGWYFVQKDASRQSCHQANRWVQTFCAQANERVVGVPSSSR